MLFPIILYEFVNNKILISKLIKLSLFSSEHAIFYRKNIGQFCCSLSINRYVLVINNI